MPNGKQPKPRFSKFEAIDKNDPKSFGAPRRGPVAPTMYKGPAGEDIALPTFEFGLVLAGAVSAGAYSAGVLDFFIEALDRWEDAKIANALEHGANFAKWSVPPHAVRLTTVAGASAGSVCSAVLARSGTGKFPSGANLSPDVAVPPKAGAPAHPNPLYELWVRRLDIHPMLNNDDLKGKTPMEIESLLNTAPLDSAASHIVSLNLPETAPRSWLEQGMEFGFTIGNLTGVSYRYQLVGLDGAEFGTRRHADLYAFSVLGSGHPPKLRPQNGALGDAFLVRATGPVRLDWKEVADAALASAAFPIGFKPRKLTKEIRLYDREPRKSTDLLAAVGPVMEGGKPTPSDAGDQWVQGANLIGGTVNTYHKDSTVEDATLPFTAVDGGTMNNQPFEYVRQNLAGPMGRNPREGIEANRAVILIDPFPATDQDESMQPGAAEPFRDSKTSTDTQPTSIFDVLPRLLSAYTNQARYDANDQALAADPEVYSRFMLSPVRAAPNGETLTGAKALASGALGAFAGFLSIAYRHHDFLLGRRNAEYFLRTYFALPQGNPLFLEEWWKDKGKDTGPKSPYWTITGIPTEKAGSAQKHERQIIPVIIPATEKEEDHLPAVGVTEKMPRLTEIRRRLLCKHPVWPGSPERLKDLLDDLEKPIRGRVDEMFNLVLRSQAGRFGGSVLGWLLKGKVRSASDKILTKLLEGLVKNGLDKESNLPT